MNLQIRHSGENYKSCSGCSAVWIGRALDSAPDCPTFFSKVNLLPASVQRFVPRGKAWPAPNPEHSTFGQLERLKENVEM